MLSLQMMAKVICVQLVVELGYDVLFQVSNETNSSFFISDKFLDLI